MARRDAVRLWVKRGSLAEISAIVAPAEGLRMDMAETEGFEPSIPFRGMTI